MTKAIIESLEPRQMLSVETAGSADAFVDSIGVNSHFSWSNIYGNASLPGLLDQLGIRHVRDNAKSTAYTRLSSLYSSYGITTDIVIDDLAGGPSAHVTALANNWAEAIEGPNEPDLTLRSYGGFTDTITNSNGVVINDFAATRRYQEELFQAAQASGSTANKPVLSPAMAYPMPTGALAGTSFDVASLHSYAEDKVPTLWRVDSQFIPKTNLMSTGATAAPIWATETGYHTGTSQYSISETANGKYLPRTLVEYFNRGIQRTYIYELASQGTDPTYAEHNFGLIRNNLTLTPAYTNIKNMISLLEEATWNTGTQTWSRPSFAPGSLDYAISTSTPTINKLLLQKSNGEFDLLLWNDVSSWNTAGKVDIANPTQNVTLTFNTALAGASLYSLGSTTATQTWNKPTQVTIGVPDEIVILKLTPRSSATPAAIGYSDNFESGTLNALPSGWSQNAGDDWQVKNGASPANKWLEARNVSGNHTIVHNLGTTVTGSWTTDFDTTWRWGGASTYGFHTLSNSFDVLDASGNGYRVKIFQGNHNNPSFNNDLTEIYKMTAGAQATSPLATGTGYNRAGWQSLGQSSPDWRHVRVAFDAGTLFVYEDVDANGAYEVVVQATDASYSSFSKVAFTTFGLANTEAAMFDNLNTSTPTVTIAATDASVAENPVNTGTFTVTRTGSTAAALVVNYTVAGSATNGTDYSSLSGTATILAGAASANITLTPTSDTTLEGDENVVLTLVETAAYHVGTKRSTDVKIGDYVADLIVTGITMSNPNPTAGAPVSFIVTVKNIGTAATPAGTIVKVNCFVDDNPGTSPYTSNTYTTSIAPGQSVNLTTTAGTNGGQWVTLPGVHNITAWVDPDPGFWVVSPAAIIEKSDINNEAYAVVNVAQAQVFDDFSAGTVGQPPASWTTSAGGFAVKNSGAQNFLEFTDNGTQSASKTLAAPANGSWQMDVKVAWRWGGFTTAPYEGFHTLATGYDLVDASGNGYRIKVYQGNGQNPAFNNALVEVYRISANVVAATAIASGGGFNIAGWQGRGLTAPDWRNLRITFDKGTRRLSIYGDSTGTGVYTPFVSFVDTSAATSVNKISLIAIGVTNNTAPEWDDFRFKILI